MIGGIGTDIVYIPRFYNILVKKYNNSPEKIVKFCKKFMHTQELQHLKVIMNKKSDKNIEQSFKYVAYVAGVWAIKESLFKSLSLSSLQHEHYLLPPAITIYSALFYKSNDSHTGKPIINVDMENLKSASISQEFQATVLNSKFHLSLSHDKDYVVSYVLRERLANKNI